MSHHMNKGLQVIKITSNPFEMRWNPAITNVVGWKVLDITWDDNGFVPGGNFLMLQSQDFTAHGCTVDSRVNNDGVPICAAWTLLPSGANRKTIYQSEVSSNSPSTVSCVKGTFYGVNNTIPTILDEHNFYLYVEMSQQF